MTGRVLLLGVLCAAVASAEGRSSGSPVDAWIGDRAGDFKSWLQLAEGATGQLWSERPTGVDPLPGFVPTPSLAPLIQAVRAGVVNISTLNRGNAQEASRAPAQSSGSGFIISSDGHVVTNDHVVAKAHEIEVRLADGREFLADVVGQDAATDVALLKLRGVGVSALPVTWLGDSDLLEVGDWVVAIGNPFGLDHSVSHGMISAKERVIGMGMFDDFIQTDTLINPGNSGGPLFNMRGEVVGVTTAIVSQGQGIGFAVPINMVKDLLPNLRENGKLERGFLGVSIADTTLKGAEGRVTVVREVFANSPAATAGLRAGDRVLAVNGRPVESYLQLMRRVAILAPGTVTRLTVQRGDAALDVAVTLGPRPAESLRAVFDASSLQALGMVLRPLGADAAVIRGRRLAGGLLVAGVVPRSAAQRAGILAGDVLVEVSRAAVRDAATLRKVLSGLEPGRPILVKVLRGESEQFLALDPS